MLVIVSLEIVTGDDTLKATLTGSTSPNAPRRRSVISQAVSLAVIGAIVGIMAATPALAQAQRSPTERIDELERKLEQSLKQIEQLSTEVSRLRTTKPAPAGPAADVNERVTQQAVKIEGLERQIDQINESNASRGLKLAGVPLHGFADIGAGASRQSNRYQTGPKGFTVGSFSLYLTPEFGERVKSLVELVFEVDRHGEISTEVERLQIGYAFSDALTLWGGRFHTPYGIWNTAFHHGLQIQTALSRPRFLEFEDRGGILPAHTIGVWATGTLPAGGARFNYDVYAGNAPRIGINAALPAPGGTLDPMAGGNTAHSTLLGFRAEFEPRGALEGLKLGVHGLRANVSDDNVTPNRTRLLTYGPYLNYTTDQWEILSELYKFRNRDTSGGTGSHGSSAWYVQAGYNTGRVTPYVRTERASLDQTDNYFALQNSGRSYQSTSLGLRFDLTNSVALKFEAGRTTLRGVKLGGGDDRFGELRTQFSIRF